MASACQDFLFALEVRLNDFEIVERKGERIEHLGWAELRITLEDALDAGSPRVKRPQTSNRHTRAEHVRTSAQHVLVHSDVGMGNQNYRELHDRARRGLQLGQDAGGNFGACEAEFFGEPLGRRGGAEAIDTDREPTITSD